MGKPAHKLQQEVETRWNSTFDMLSRLYEQREPVGAALLSLRTDLAPLSSAEYHTMWECLGVLFPLKDATAELSAEKTVWLQGHSPHSHVESCYIYKAASGDREGSTALHQPHHTNV